MPNQNVSVRYRLGPFTKPHQCSSARRTKLAFKNANVDTRSRQEQYQISRYNGKYPRTEVQPTLGTPRS